ncbi:MAG: hypothetical protein HN657_04540 [Candidatus Marinimicrobia bacterium]|jgi:predicted enzyme related to lactoylglutathione lyase|nr:hypothetical protein [Candidatus Neomarinimicrobiota bacterium]MBT3497083.1 hypothetical protein [Candidatus Neomarinimicrobiota bacterium]MBT3731875.1 hypothetical protein [Candidatus Neomarinimicrobiota bacterium]MBT4144675.1 hypothetical protein [Candidatus Neomarinimicrobiota bacterium]MBT4177948.1 hypothetical protein [Candidatus Neomarinimicrobiota bacterium]
MKTSKKQSPEFRMSKNIALNSQNWEQSVAFYQSVMGLNIKKNETHVEVQNGPITMFVQENPNMSPLVMEYYVDDLHTARAYLKSHGCKVIKWEGKGKDCYMKDPFGLTFNLWETTK